MQINDDNSKCFGCIFKITDDDDDDAGLKAVFVKAFQLLPDSFFSFYLLSDSTKEFTGLFSSFRVTGVRLDLSDPLALLDPL